MLCYLGPTRVHNQNGISIDSAVFCTAHGRVRRRRCWGTPFPVKIASFQGRSEPPSNTWFLGSTNSACQTASRSVQPFMHSYGGQSLYLTMGSLPPKLPLPIRDLDPSNTLFLGPTRVLNPNGISIGSAVFCTVHGTASVYFTMARPCSPKNCPSRGGSGPHLRHGSLAYYCERPIQTDHANRSVTVGRIHVRSTAMRSNNNNNKCLKTT